jgi:ATP-dependent DNA ligase
MQPLGLCLLPACVMALSRRYALTCSENSRASKVSNVRSLICRKAVWGEGLTAADMEKCLWLKPKLVAAIEYAEWTPANHLRHSRFVALREDKDPRKVTRERSM